VVRKFINGGQTGADRAGLDFAIEVGLEHSGSEGDRAEDGRISEHYHLTELSSGRSSAHVHLRAAHGTQKQTERVTLDSGRAAGDPGRSLLAFS